MKPTWTLKVDVPEGVDSIEVYAVASDGIAYHIGTVGKDGIMRPSQPLPENTETITLRLESVAEGDTQ